MFGGDPFNLRGSANRRRPCGSSDLRCTAAASRPHLPRAKARISRRESCDVREQGAPGLLSP
jgi:hypothetical protein